MCYSCGEWFLLSDIENNPYYEAYYDYLNMCGCECLDCDFNGEQNYSKDEEKFFESDYQEHILTSHDLL